MKLRLVLNNRNPKFYYTCLECGRRHLSFYDSNNESAWYDVEGEPFKSYYCHTCVRTSPRNLWKFMDTKIQEYMKENLPDNPMKK